MKDDNDIKIGFFAIDENGKIEGPFPITSLDINYIKEYETPRRKQSKR